MRKGEKYQYTVKVEAGGLLSDPSPALLYTHGQPYCGDGLTQGFVFLSIHMTDEHHLSILTRESLALPDDDDGPLSLSLQDRRV